MSEIDPKTEALVPAWVTLPEIAEILGVDILKVRQQLKERKFLAVRRGEHRALQVPADFFQDGNIVKGLVGTLTLLSDSNFSDEEALEWLFTADDTLPGTPVQALQENRMTEVRRRAQALAI
ncbi:Rv2175c family DNA-binding protein [Embleya hyalina]|uniref:Transcriptional regulator n=1 Tax=Embleya hyalina TaxID=516124 RepID=A0A401YNP7_9ACTN|nr:Rv2175c family DNA-binding protein [Embleya hyalina]GCD96242.1 transcriptional regulator [Embleya hyalina]